MVGSYILNLEVVTPIAPMPIGRFGRFGFAPGFYLYVGSAFGAGGLRARLAHHLRNPKPHLHWHVDYLRATATLHEAWVAVGAPRRECIWCRQLAADERLYIPIPRFGARDTGCAAHLFFLPTRPDVTQFSYLGCTDVWRGELSG